MLPINNNNLKECKLTIEEIETELKGIKMIMERNLTLHDLIYYENRIKELNRIKRETGGKL